MTILRMLLMSVDVGRLKRQNDTLDDLSLPVQNAASRKKGVLAVIFDR